MTNFLVRLVAFTILLSALFLPGYLSAKLHCLELLWLYPPAVALVAAAILEATERDNRGGTDG